MTIQNDPGASTTRGNFRFINVNAGTDSHRSIEVRSVDSAQATVTDLHPNTTEEETRAQMVADGYIEIDREGQPVDPRHNVLQNEAVRAILEQAIEALAALGVAAFNQPLVSPVDGSAGWFLIAASDHADVTSLRALLTAGCDGCGADPQAYLKALRMIGLMTE